MHVQYSNKSARRHFKYLNKFMVMLALFGTTTGASACMQVEYSPLDTSTAIDSILGIMAVDSSSSAPPTSFSFSLSSATIDRLHNIQFEPTLSGGTITSCIAEPPLPAGLVLNQNTCALTGKALNASSTSTYTIIAANSGGSLSTDITITVNDILPFITTWKTDNIDTLTFTASNQVKLPLDAAGTYDFTVDWGDGSSSIITAHNQSEIIHTYAVPGTYDITMFGQIEGFGFFQLYSGQIATEDHSKLIDIKQWGDVRLHNKGGQFYICHNLPGFSATDVPDLNHITRLDHMFMNANSFNGNVSAWDISNVTRIDAMFEYAAPFNQDLSSWNTSKVTNMRSIFWGATSFNGDVTTWDISGVTSMHGVFGQTSFNRDITHWDVSHITDMRYMFYNSNFNQDISAWDVSNVTNMEALFSGTPFNQDISGWNISKVTNMGSLFGSASAFNQDLSAWDVSNVTNMAGMFWFNTTFDYSSIVNWDLSNVINMQSMFYNATGFNQDISGWNVAKATNMKWMFRAASGFNQDIFSWNVSSVVDMEGMFHDASSFNQNLSGWCVSNIGSTPIDFNTNAGALTPPVWGTCP